MAQTFSLSQTFSRQQRRWSALLLLAGVVLLALVIWVQWHFVRSNPKRTFYAAIENSLRTPDVSKQISQEGPGQNLSQQVQLNLGPSHITRAQATIMGSGQANTTVKTDTVATPREDFVRYTAITTDQKGASGKVLDFSKLLNIWGKSGSLDGKQTTGELYSESVLGIVPIGNVSGEQRTGLMDFIKHKKVFTFDEAKIKKSQEGNRPVYTYEVTVSPEPYVGMLKRYAKAVGLTQLETLDPSTYRTARPITVSVSIDVWSQQVTRIQYPEGARTERLGSYGVHHEASIPTKSVPVEELQQRLQAIQ